MSDMSPGLNFFYSPKILILATWDILTAMPSLLFPASIVITILYETLMFPLSLL